MVPCSRVEREDTMGKLLKTACLILGTLGASGCTYTQNVIAIGAAQAEAREASGASEEYPKRDCRFDPAAGRHLVYVQQYRGTQYTRTLEWC